MVKELSFSWEDEPDPDDPSGVATFMVGGITVVKWLPTFVDANDIFNLLKTAYTVGAINMRDAATIACINTISELPVRKVT